MNGAQRRVDFYRNGQLERITVSDPAVGEIRSYRIQNRQCVITPIPGNFCESSSDALDAGAVVTPEGCESVGEFHCTRFRVTRADQLSEVRWYDERSRLCIQTQTFNAFGQSVLRVKWTDISLEAPPASAFERLVGFREVKIRL